MAIYAFCLAFFLILLAACSTPQSPPQLTDIAASASTTDNPPPAPREFRAAWISTVTNIDWPSRRDLSVAQQQAEIIAILDRASALNLNALVLQVRPSADAIYPSALEPWSEYLTGEQGKPPQPFYDPLKMWIDEAHRRGIELHAWFNPYRAQHSAAKSALARSHIANTNPSLVKAYGGFLWMDPGEALAAQRTVDVILDVVRRYDIDGVHIDDYFYPYPVAVNAALAANAANASVPEVDFPDEPSWRRFRAGGGTLSRADWRRQNVNALIERLHTGIHREKSWVKFGISPFGIGRPDRRPAGIVGFSQYDKLYADVELWLRNGWLDYLAPQLYWPLTQAPQAFEVLLDYWRRANTRGRHLWPGLFTSRITQPNGNNIAADAAAKSWLPDEILNQIATMRRKDGVSGHLHFSMIALTENRRGISEQLISGPYLAAALVPATPWLALPSTEPSAPRIELAAANGNGNVKIKLSAGDGAPPVQYAIWARYGSNWRFILVPATRAETVLIGATSSGTLNSIVASAVDRLGRESARVSATLPPAK